MESVSICSKTLDPDNFSTNYQLHRDIQDSVGNSDNDDTEEEDNDDGDDDDDSQNSIDNFNNHIDDDGLNTSILKEIAHGTYTCLICTCEIDFHSQIWPCIACYRVYDLDCIRDWAIRGSSTDSRHNWRCPSCNHKINQIPSNYYCWCKKVKNPPPNIFAPHSCSQSCNFPLQNCPHNCSLPCHPGPHIKVCSALVNLKCKCGAQQKSYPCLIAPYKDQWSCQLPCNQLMPCLVHRHNLICHSGLCGLCKIKLKTTCYCGKDSALKECYQLSPILCSNLENFSWIGSYQCSSQICDTILDCGNLDHRCTKNYCHPQSNDPSSSDYHRCILNPKVLTHCPCGKHLISDLLFGKKRLKCSDPVPTCNDICAKILPCGHTCYWKCHLDQIHSPCYRSIETKCSCGFNSFLVPCSFSQPGNKPKCQRKCQALKNCRRHRCNNICCSYEKIAFDRDRLKKKISRKGSSLSINNDHANNIESIHICSLPCEKLLSCKRHHCHLQDHPGKCPPCLESSSDDLLCACGKTVLIPAPVRCGSLPIVSCQYQCHRPSSCGHKISHLCHQDDVQCPGCTKFVTKTCKCGKKQVPNIFCHQNNVSCGLPCGKLLPCSHKCQKICCDQNFDHTTAKCIALCNQKKIFCQHLDKSRCHWPNKCNENIPCSELITLHCFCGRITKKIKCTASINNPSDGSQKFIDCDSECERIERNRKLFEALDLKTIDGNARPPEELFVNPYPKWILLNYEKQKNWCLEIENSFKNLILSSSNQTAKKFIFFPAMKSPQRKFIHGLAEIYNLFSESKDPEPYRFVSVYITDKTKIPDMLIEEAIISDKKIQINKEIQNEIKLEGEGEYNGILIENCLFGSTALDLEKALSSCYKNSQLMEDPVIKWHSDNDYVFLSKNFYRNTKKLEIELRKLSKQFLNIVRAKSLAFDIVLCKFDSDGDKIINRETKNLSIKESTAEKPNMTTFSNNSFDLLNSTEQTSKSTAYDWWD
ncbi:Fap1p ASCRUDRAFT_77392 [Ascoidea rubescens DSM 1968]|uniref:R3H domain-containing protein n=1 Tax=Ascoidea rubescens DSM 1968 TaxID=1344418 RepID=A0A1D2VBH9_9ASCO|nr:hypothetical protein ASCRUDRAFT_77392 [Ascoidea rubescens DSM 1968]ODV58960.1 hypothetical protein ASCRUDRAFT_77392 [Ascoidea rubescens DSM 1968]